MQPDLENVKTQGKLRAKSPTLGLREQVLDTGVAWLVMAGGVIVAAGSLMPWVSTATILGSINRSAWQLGSGLSDDGTGPLLLILGLLIASVGWAMLGGRARRYGSKRTAIVIEVILLLLLILIFKPLIDFANQGGTKFTVGSIGIGYWISVVGTFVALVGSIKFPKVSSDESVGFTEALTKIETHRAKTKRWIVFSVLAVVILLAGLAVGLNLSRTKQQNVILNTRELSIDGVHLEKGDAIFVQIRGPIGDPTRRSHRFISRVQFNNLRW
jgi:amino acid transporter